MEVQDKVAVYPYDRNFTSAIRHNKLLKNLNITGLISPNGWGISGRDAGYADGGNNIGIIVESEFDRISDLCETILFIQSENKIDFDKFILPQIKVSIERGKNIIYSVKHDIEHRCIINELCKDKGVKFKYFGDREQYEDLKKNQLHKINTPVILVLGTGERTNKFEIQLSLREHLTNLGYKISQIGTKSFCELFGFHSFPEFMFTNSHVESDKILMFNNFVKKIEREENPDMIIIGVPGGVMSFNDMFTNYFGILAYEVSQAVSPDFTILSVLYGDYMPDFFDKISVNLKYRLGVDIDCFNVANTKINWEFSKALHKIQYVTLESKCVEMIKKKFLRLDIPIYNIINENESQKMADYLVDKMSTYADISCL